VKRRERTRQLIELGGLIAKAGLIDLTDDDRAVIFGLLVAAAATLRSEARDDAIVVWRRRGKRAFESEPPRIDPIIEQDARTPTPSSRRSRACLACVPAETTEPIADRLPLPAPPPMHRATEAARDE
jgi:hypothetical protein